jgi:hypothetical protein
MRKFFGSIFLALAIISTVVFFILLNLSFFASENKIKGILEKGKFYDSIAFYIKNEIVTKSDLKINEGTNFEDLNQTVSADNIKNTIKNGLHDIFSSLKDPNSAERVFPIRFYNENADGSKLYFEKYFNIRDNLAFDILSRKNIILLISGVLSLALLLIGILIFSKKTQDSLMFLGAYSLSTMLFLAIIMVLLKILESNYMQTFAGQINLFNDAKLLAILKRLLSAIMNSQFYYYLLETVGLFALSITSFSLRKMLLREELADIDKKI